MPPAGSFNSPMSPFPPFNNAAAMAQQGPQHQYIPSQESEPTHVVGSQGRRGILPSVPGRAPAPSSINTVSAKSLIPTKDADGKFPCPHCNKTYLHAKHLKRHLLRRSYKLSRGVYPLADLFQTPVTDRTCAISVKILSAEVTS